MQALTTVVARVLFGLPMIIIGIFHFMAGGNMAGMVPIPGGVFWIYLTGVALILAGIAIIIKNRARLASLLLALMITIFTLTIHIPGMFDPTTMQMEMMNTLKNLIMIGGALGFANIFGSEYISNTDRVNYLFKKRRHVLCRLFF